MPTDKQMPTIKVIGVILAGWLILGVIIATAVTLVSFWNIDATTGTTASAPHQSSGYPLETAPQPDLQAYLDEKQTLIDDYAWVDQQSEVARIPLTLAMDSLAGEPLQQSDPPTPGHFRQNLGARLPLGALFQDERGETRELGSFFDNGPVLLVLGYYHCPRLCSTVMAGVLQSVQDLSLPYSVVAVSIDPRETPDIAARQHAFYVSTDAQNGNALHLLTGQNAAIADLTRLAGFAWRYDAASDQYTHPAGFMIVSPEGRISRYFPGVRFDRRDVRLALIEASEDRTGTLAERITLLCSHYDPVQGRYSLAVMQLVRVFSALLLLIMLGWLWRLARRKRRRP